MPLESSPCRSDPGGEGLSSTTTAASQSRSPPPHFFCAKKKNCDAPNKHLSVRLTNTELDRKIHACLPPPRHWPPAPCPQEGEGPPRPLGQSGLQKKSFLTPKWNSSASEHLQRASSIPTGSPKTALPLHGVGGCSRKAPNSQNYPHTQVGESRGGALTAAAGSLLEAGGSGSLPAPGP